MNALQLQNLATLAAAAAAAQTSATSTNANPLSSTSSALGALTSPGEWEAYCHKPHLHAPKGREQGWSRKPAQGLCLVIVPTFLRRNLNECVLFSKGKMRQVFNEELHSLFIFTNVSFLSSNT